MARKAEKPFVRDLRELMREHACREGLASALRGVRRRASWQDAWDRCKNGQHMDYVFWALACRLYAVIPFAGRYAKTTVAERFRRAFREAFSMKYSTAGVDNMATAALSDLADLIRKFWPKAPRLLRTEVGR